MCIFVKKTNYEKMLNKYLNEIEERKLVKSSASVNLKHSFSTIVDFIAVAELCWLLFLFANAKDKRRRNEKTKKENEQ